MQRYCENCEANVTSEVGDDEYFVCPYCGWGEETVKEPYICTACFEKDDYCILKANYLPAHCPEDKEFRTNWKATRTKLCRDNDGCSGGVMFEHPDGTWICDVCHKRIY